MSIFDDVEHWVQQFKESTGELPTHYHSHASLRSFMERHGLKFAPMVWMGRDWPVPAKAAHKRKYQRRRRR